LRKFSLNKPSIGSIKILIAFILLGCTLFPASFAVAADQIVFPSSDRTRYEVIFDFTQYVNNNAHIDITVVQSDFDTGARTRVNYAFEDSSLNPKQKLNGNISEIHGVIDGSSSQLRAYASLPTEGIIPGDGGEVLYRFDLTTGSLTKMAEYQEATWITILPQLQLYQVHDYLNNEVHLHTYSLDTMKPLFTKGAYSAIETVDQLKASCTSGCQHTDYIISTLNTDNERIQNYKVQSHGKLTPVQIKYEEVEKSGATIRYLHGNGGKLKLEYYTTPNKQNAARVTWIKGSSKKVILNTKGRIFTYASPVFSPDGKSIAFATEILGEHMRKLDFTIYVYNTKDMSLVSKIKPDYGLGVYRLIFDSNTLLRIKYETSRPGDYRDVYHDLLTGTAVTAGYDSLTIRDADHYDNFKYDHLFSLELPVPVLVNNKYIRYSGHGSFRKNGNIYVPLTDLAAQTGTQVTMELADIRLERNGHIMTVSKKSLESLGDNWFIPVRQLEPIGLKMAYSRSIAVFLENTDK